MFPEMSRRLFDRAKDPKTLVVINGAGHSDLFSVGGEAYRQALRSFITQDSTPLASQGNLQEPHLQIH
jgi:fermentation-respiration switch protein FrsA (DUF1100 family)